MAEIVPLNAFADKQRKATGLGGVRTMGVDADFSAYAEKVKFARETLTWPSALAANDTIPLCIPAGKGRLVPELCRAVLSTGTTTLTIRRRAGGAAGTTLTALTAALSCSTTEAPFVRTTADSWDAGDQLELLNTVGTPASGATATIQLAFAMDD